jgi:replicative DNA helicase
MSEPEIEARSLRDLLIARADGQDVPDERIRVLRREDELVRAAMAYPKALLSSGVIPSMFEGADYGIAWSAAIAASATMPSASGDPLSNETVLAEMRRRNEQRFAGPSGLLWMASVTAQKPVEIGYALDVLAKEMIARHHLRVWRHRTGKLNEQIDSTKDILGLHEEYITESLGISISPDGGRLGELPEDLPWDAHNRSNPNIVPSGFGKIDKAAGGGHGRGDLGVVGGGTNHGKSYWAQRYLRNQARLGRSVLYISVEDPQELMFCRMLADFSSPKLRPVHIRQKLADPRVVEQARLAMAAELRGLVRYVIRKKATVAEVCQIIRRHRFMVGIDSVVIDYLQAVQPNKTTNNKTQDTAFIVSELKKCFEDCGVAGWVLSQYARDGYREGAEPGIQACKYAGDIENEAEIMCLLWRDDEGRLHAKLPKVKWSQAQGLRYIIDTDESGCLLDWQDDFEQPQEDQEPRRGGGKKGQQR